MYTEMLLIFFVRGVTRGGGSPEVPVYPSLVGEMTSFDVNNILTLQFRLARTLESKDA